VAANFVLHVNDLMNGKASLARVPGGLPSFVAHPAEASAVGD
jgi:hypothetical protein